MYHISTTRNQTITSTHQLSKPSLLTPIKQQHSKQKQHLGQCNLAIYKKTPTKNHHHTNKQQPTPSHTHYTYKPYQKTYTRH